VDAEQAAATHAKKKEDAINEPVKEVVRMCLQVEPEERPDIDQLISMVERVVEQLPEDGDGALDED
jgi:serine/threonine kinase 16